MDQLIGASIGALAVICIPLFGWFSRRVTPEGRLILRVERLGSVYALMPKSLESDEFKTHLTEAIGNLNEWLDADSRKRRRIVRTVSIVSYVVGIALALPIIGLVDESVRSWLSPVVGAVIGGAIVGASSLTNRYLEIRERRKTKRTSEARDEAAAAERMEAVRRGLPIPVQIDQGGRPA